MRYNFSGGFFNLKSLSKISQNLECMISLKNLERPTLKIRRPEFVYKFPKPRNN